MKKFLVMTLTLLMLVASLAACGSNNDPAPATEPDNNEATEPKTEPSDETPEAGDDTKAEEPGSSDGLKVGVCIYKFDDNFMTLYREYLEEYLTATYGADVTVADGKNDQAEQTNQIENFITQGVDVLVVNLVQASAAEQVADKCHAAGIPVVFINREPDEAEQQRWADEGINATYVGADARQSGTFQGEIVLELENKGDINGDGVINYVMVIGDPENVDAQYRTEFSVKALVDAGMEVNELVAERGDWDQVKGQEIVANALAAHGDAIEVVFCNNDAMALGAAQAIEGAGRKVGEDIYLLGVDALTECVEMVIDGTMTGTVFNDHFSQAETAAQAAKDFVDGKDVPTYIPVDYVKITDENANAILEKIK